MLDNRIKILAKNLVNYSVKAKKGDKVLIEAYDLDSALVTCLVDEIRSVGAYAFVELFDSKVQRRLLLNADETYCKLLEKYNRVRMEDMDCYIGTVTFNGRTDQRAGHSLKGNLPEVVGFFCRRGTDSHYLHPPNP